MMNRMLLLVILVTGVIGAFLTTYFRTQDAFDCAARSGHPDDPDMVAACLDSQGGVW